MDSVTSRKVGRHDRRWIAGLGLVAGAVVFAVVIPLWLVRAERNAVRRAMAEGRPERASRALERWLEASPRSAEAHFIKAHVAWVDRDLGTVKRELELARALGHPPDQMGRLLGLLLARVGQTAEAEPHLRRAFDEARVADPEVADALARIYLGSFRLDEAGAVLDRWARDVPDDARPCLLRAEVDYRIASDSSVVIASYREALRRDPDLSQARLGLANLLRDCHRNAEAADEYARYVAREPNDPMGYLGAGNNARDMGDRAEAVRNLDRALALAPRDPVALAARASVEISAGRFDRALEYSDRAVQADPFDHANRYQRMLILRGLGRKAEAAAECRAVARIRRDQARFDRLKDALVRSPRDNGLRARAATWLMEHGRPEEAIEWANLVLAAQPDHPEMNRLLADHYRKAGQIGLANRYEALAGPGPSAASRSTPAPLDPEFVEASD